MGPPGANGGAVVSMACDILAADATSSTAGTVLMMGRELQIVAGSEVLVDVAAHVRMTRQSGSLTADLALQERINNGAVWSTWATVSSLRGAMIGQSSPSVDIRDTRSAIHRRALDGVAAIQYRLTCTNLSTEPVATLSLYAGSAIKMTVLA